MSTTYEDKKKVLLYILVIQKLENNELIPKESLLELVVQDKEQYIVSWIPLSSASSLLYSSAKCS